MNNLIDRQTVIDALEKVAELFPWKVPGNRDSYDRYNEAWNDAIGRAEIEIEKLPSAQPEEFEWCHDCKEYDQTEHCCHRWTKVIRQTVEELKAWPKTGKWTIKNGELAFWDVCSVCGKMVMHKAPFYNYCPNCGAKMEGD